MFNHSIITHIQEQLHVKVAILFGFGDNHQKSSSVLMLPCLAAKNSLLIMELSHQKTTICNRHGSTKIQFKIQIATTVPQGTSIANLALVQIKIKGIYQTPWWLHGGPLGSDSLKEYCYSVSIYYHSIKGQKKYKDCTFKCFH